ncbi:MAG: IS110 family transposase [bacterium]
MKRTRKQKKQELQEIPKLESLKQINLNAAGIDVGNTEIWVCVPEEREEQPVQSFGTFTCELYKIADWLEVCGVETVAMESTSIYWIPLYEILTNRGIKTYVVNAQHAKNMPGRKTDILDCQWLQQLHTYGLLTASFQPPENILALRGLLRHCDNLIRYRASHIQHMQKALHLMNIQLDNVISDITGLTGMRIIRAILDGERNPLTLAQYRNPHCKNSQDVIAQSLEGNYRKEHLFALKQAVELYDVYTRKIEECATELEKEYALLPVKVNLADKPLPKPRKRHLWVEPAKNAGAFDLRTALYQMCGVDLTAVDGLNAQTIQIVLSETGVDMGAWRTPKHFSSWLCLCPNNKISGGRVLSRRTQKNKNRASRALRLAARSLHHSDSALGAFYRRMRARLGGPKAVTAAAHKLARIIYTMITKQVEYVDLGADYYEAKYKEREIRKLKQKAARLGFQLVPVAA